MRILLAALALSFSLAACGDDDPITSGGASEKPEETAIASETATEAVPVEVEVCALAAEADVEAAFGGDVPPGEVVERGSQRGRHPVGE